MSHEDPSRHLRDPSDDHLADVAAPQRVSMGEFGQARCLSRYEIRLEFVRHWAMIMPTGHDLGLFPGIGAPRLAVPSPHVGGGWL